MMGYPQSRQDAGEDLRVRGCLPPPPSFTSLPGGACGATDVRDPLTELSFTLIGGASWG